MFCSTDKLIEMEEQMYLELEQLDPFGGKILNPPLLYANFSNFFELVFVIVDHIERAKLEQKHHDNGITTLVLHGGCCSEQIIQHQLTACNEMEVSPGVERAGHILKSGQSTLLAKISVSCVIHLIL
jgi:hypothetical protein